MSKKHTIFTPMKGPKVSFINELYQPFYSDTVTDHFQEIEELHDILTNPSLKRLYDLTIQSLQAQNNFDSVFFVDKLLSLTNNNKGIIFLAGQCYFANGDFKKVHSLFSQNRVLALNINFQLLAAKATFQSKQYEKCVEILDMTLENTFFSKKLEGAKFLIRAQCCEAKESKLAAIQMYTECLRKDSTCVEAFNKLMDCFMLSAAQKDKLLKELDFAVEDEWLRKYYISRVKENVNVESQITPIEDNDDNGNVHSVNENNIYELLLNRENVDILCIQAKSAFSRYDITKAFEISDKAIKIDPCYFDILPIYCACLLDLGYVSDLYYCAHTLIENYPNHQLSWFAVGTYYFLIKKYEIARKHYQKSLSIGKDFLYAWIGLAHSYAVQDQSDQAMAVYRSVARLFPGCHSAHLYMGMEYLRLNNKTALLALQTASDINPKDPLVFNQIGSFYYKLKDYKEAKVHFLKALDLSGSAIGWVVETILGNLAHACRKLKEYKEAIKWLEKSISINAHNPHTLFSLAFVHHLSFSISKAISYYHKSLKHKHDNQFAADMLNKALNDASDEKMEALYNV